jgi:citrate synthase
VSAKPEPTTSDVAAWWGTAISRMEPNVIELRGHPVQDLIGTTSLTEMIWLMLRGDRPTAGQARLLEAALVAAVDHGPHAPSIAIARMAATCGVGLNNAVANGVNVLGDNHGGAGEQCLALLGDICGRAAETGSFPRDRRAPSFPRDRRAPSSEFVMGTTLDRD